MLLSSSQIESTAGFTAGIVATLAVHPFDLLKTRLQLQTSTPAYFGQSLSLLRKIVLTEGPTSKSASLGALYRGLTPNLVGNSVSWALYFYFYAHAKDVVRQSRHHHHPENKSPYGSALTHLDYFLASSLAGSLTALVTNPVWVIKTRMLSTGASASASPSTTATATATSCLGPPRYRNMWHGAQSIWAIEGIRGFWRGFLPSLVGISHGAVQFTIYEVLKNSQRRRNHNQIDNWDYLTLSCVSKIVAGTTTYPFQLLKARLQSYDAPKRYTGVTDAIGKIWRYEGVRGFYKGLVPNLVRVLPSTCVTFLVYENIKIYLGMS